MNIAILCGGRGTRLESKTKGKPKILIDVNKKPFVYLLLESLINKGFNNIFLLTSYKSNFIKEEVGKFYKNIPINYIEDDNNFKSGTASALLNAIDKLPSHFLLQYGDTILDINYKDFYHKSEILDNYLLMSIFDNKNNLDKNNVLYDNKSLIYYNSESPKNHNKIFDANFIDYGLLGMHKKFVDKYIGILSENESLKYYQEKLSLRNLIYPYIVHKRFYEIGNPESYENFKNNYVSGKLKKIINSCN